MLMQEHLKNRMRLWRAANGLTLEEISDLTGYSAAMLSRAERGERTILTVGEGPNRSHTRSASRRPV